jgi:hypothetical protein
VRLRTWTQTLLLVIAPSLGVLSSTSVALAQPAAAEPSEKAVKEATAQFKKGSDFYNAKKYSQALEAFRKSYASVASPNSHLYIARSLAALGQHREAYLEFDLVIAEAETRGKEEPKYLPTRDTAQLERDELATKIGLVTVNVSGAGADAKLLVAGTEVPRERWGKPYPIAPGSAEVVLQEPAKPPVTKMVTVRAGSKDTVAIAPESSATAGGGSSGDTGGDAGGSSGGGDTGGGGGTKKSSPLRPAAFAAAGLGVAGFAVFGIAGAITSSTYSELTDLCGGERACPPDKADDAADKVSSGQTTQTIANIGLIVGAVGVAAAVPLFILSMKKPSEQPKTDASVIAGPGYIGVRGTF